MNIQEIIGTLDLNPHPEGGFYRETCRSEVMHGRHSVSTAIYFLLPNGDVSHLHRITSDEIWHFYLGDALEITEILPDKTLRKTLLGKDLKAGQVLQYCVSAGHWFGAAPCEGTEFALVGCTVAPGFSFDDFELGDRQQLLKQFPEYQEEILKLT
ncbi:MAG: cupin domain-containing protein [Prevotellaceae bacterium]|jgi:predicted cupin superfamily sugar epimerase|nr:cupin domain-containing protein [Prevotellaceae bacterium]